MRIRVGHRQDTQAPRTVHGQQVGRGGDHRRQVAANRIGDGRRTALVRHVGQRYLGLAGQHGAQEMHGRARAWRAERGHGRLLFGQLQEGLQGAGRALCTHGQRESHGGGSTHTRDIFERVELHRFVEVGVQRQVALGCKHQRLTVSGCGQQGVGCQSARSTWPVFHQHGVARIAKALAHGTCHQIGSASRCVTHQDAQGLALCAGWQKCRQPEGAQCAYTGAAVDDHVFVSGRCEKCGLSM